jgi:hypothetical protein
MTGESLGVGLWPDRGLILTDGHESGVPVTLAERQPFGRLLAVQRPPRRHGLDGHR